MDQMEQPQEEQGEEKDLTSVIQEAGMAIAKMADIVNKTQGASPEARAALMSLMKSFQNVAQKISGGGANEEPMPADAGAVPMEGGMNGVPMGPQSRQ